MSEFLSGDHGALEKEVANSFVSFASFRSASVDMSTDAYPTTVWGSNVKTSINGLPSCEITAEALVMDTDLPTILQTLSNNSPQTYRLTPSTLAANNTIEGVFNVSGSLQIAQGSALSSSLKMSAAGPITVS